MGFNELEALTGRKYDSAKVHIRALRQSVRSQRVHNRGEEAQESTPYNYKPVESKKSVFVSRFMVPKICVQILGFQTKIGVTLLCNSLIFNVGAKGFEPSTPCSQSRCASRTAPYPEKKDDASSSSFFRGEGGIRTPGTPCGIRQFSKLLVSATHPPLLGCEMRCKSTTFSNTCNLFLRLFCEKVYYRLNFNNIVL